MQVQTLFENYRTEQEVIFAINEFSTNIQESIRNVIHKKGYLTYKIHRRRVLTHGANFLGKLYEVDVRGKTKNGDTETNLFLKITNKGEYKKNWVSLTDVYRTELFAYRELSEIYAELQQDANVPPHELYNMVKSYEGSSAEAIIMENIAKKGFKMYDKTKVISLEFAERSIKELAKLHGLSFALQAQRPDYFNTNIKGMRFPIMFDGNFRGFVKDMVKSTTEDIDDTDIKSRVENVYNKLANKYAQFFEDEATKRCLCHGDYRSSNMMIKMNNGHLSDFIAVDYQTLYYGCPAMDLIHFLFLNADHQFRKAHLSHLKDLYHEALTTFLKYFNIDVDSVYPRAMFEQDFEAKLGYGLLIGFVFLPLALSNSVANTRGDTVSGTNFQVSDTYRARQRGMIEEFIEWGYI